MLRAIGLQDNLGPPKPAELRAFVPLFLAFREIAVSVVVQGVSSEPVSAEFPVKQGKNREFSQNQLRSADLYGLSDWDLKLFC